MALRRSLTVRLGLGLILAPLAWFAATEWWAQTRTWIPLSTPVSLVHRHVRTEPFRIDAASPRYEIHFIAHRKSANDGVPCFALNIQCDGRHRAQVAWSVSRRGRELARGNSAGSFGFGGADSMGIVLGSFPATPGLYVLKLEFSGDPLDAGESRLLVFEAGDARDAAFDRETNAFFALILLSFVGVSLIIHELRFQRRAGQQLRNQANSLTQLGPHSRDLPVHSPPPLFHLPRTCKPTPARPIAGLTAFPLVMLIFLMAPLFSLMVSNYFEIPSTGIKVRLVGPQPFASPSPGIQPLLVQVSAAALRQGVRVDSELVRWDALPAVLQYALTRRPPEWPVYVEGDPTLEWKHVMRAVDVIHGLGGRVTLLTTRPRP